MNKLNIQLGVALVLSLGLFSVWSLTPVQAQTPSTTTDTSGTITTYADNPIVQLEVPIGETVQVSGIAEYVQVFYRFAVAAVAIIAAVLMMYAGITWLTAAGNSTKIGEAKERIWAALSGLILAMLSYAILQTLNPALVNPTNPQIEIPALEEGASLTESGVTSLTSTGACTSKTQQCLGQKYPYIAAQNQTELETHLVTLTINDGLGTTRTVRVHEDAAGAFSNVFSTYYAMNTTFRNTAYAYPMDTAHTNTYAWRRNVNSPECMSNHSFGFAIDFNWDVNPNCPSTSTCYISKTEAESLGDTPNVCQQFTALNGGKTTCDMPDWFFNMWVSNGFTWGGSWGSLKDYMHYEWTGHGCW